MELSKITLVSASDEDAIAQIKAIGTDTFTVDRHDVLGIAMLRGDLAKHKVWMERTVEQAVSEGGAFVIRQEGKVVAMVCLKWDGVELDEQGGKFGPPLTPSEKTELKPVFDHVDQIEEALLLPSGLDTTRTIFVRCLAVSADHQRRGLGSELVRYIKRLAEERQVGVTLYIQEIENMRFYSERGFEIWGPEEVGWQGWRMRYWVGTYRPGGS